MMRFFILLLSLFLLFPQVANAALVSWWKLDEASWNGTANEVVDSAGANHGTAGGGATTKVGKIDRAGSFDGSNDYVTMGDITAADGAAALTLSVWIKSNSLSSTIFGKWHDPIANPHAFLMSLSGGKFRPAIRGANGNYLYGDSTQTIPTNTWTHLTAVWPGGNTLLFYINGTNASFSYVSQQNIDSVRNSGEAFTIGARDTGVSFFNGLIDDVRVYSHALTANEVAELYYSGAKTRIRNATLRNMTIGTTTTWTCGDSITVAHTAGNISPVTVNITYGTVSTAITGATKCWITRNLGATTQASSATDNTDASAGWYWQFNRKQGYAVGPTPAWTITSIDEASNWTSANDPCTLLLGTGWRLPTRTEWTNADGSPQNWANYNDTYASVLKLHAAGYLDLSNGALGNRGSVGYDWSNTQLSTTDGRNLYFSSGLSLMDSNFKAYGFSVRCLKD